MEIALGGAKWLVGKVLNKLSEDLVAGYVASGNLGLNYEKIETELEATQALLHEANQRDMCNNLGLQRLLQKLGRKADEAEDALDELHYFMIQDKLEGTREANVELDDNLTSHAMHGCHSIRHAVGTNFPSSFSRSRKQADTDITNYSRDTKRAKSGNSNDGHVEKLPFDRVAMSTKIKSVIESIHSLCVKITPILQLHCTSNPERMGATLKRPPTSSMITQEKLYGRDAIFSKTINEMTSGMYHESLSVLPIVGPGGVGKTTFAQHLYNDERTKEHFPFRAWVCVSVNFDVLRLTQEILSCIPAAENEDRSRVNTTTNLSLLHEYIEHRMKSKRFLIVFDDIWELNNKSDWVTLLAPFRKGETDGNLVLVTTRFPKIENMVKEETNPINLQGLEPDEFWNFFQVCVFGEVQDEHDKDGLIDIAKAISDKLKCSPLAAKTVGPLLQKNHTREHWKEILEKKEWKNLKRKDDIMPALKISYDYLPFHLKKCFSYCALFPEDYRFDSSELTRFWHAIGLIDTSGQAGGGSAEDLGSNYLIELVENGFLIKQDNGRSEYYILHDLLHELSQSVSIQECVSISFSGFIADNIPLSVRHVSVTIQDKCFENIEEEMDKLKRRINIGNLRSLMIFPSYRHQENSLLEHSASKKHVSILKDTFSEIKNLRVLFICLYSPEILPHNFSKLIHLRYLHIEKFRIRYLPNGISRFYHLNYFFWGSKYISEHYNTPVPKDFNCLINLRHFDASSKLHSTIPGVGKMECLEVLHMFCVKKESVGFELAELGKLTKLSQRLNIYNLEKVRTKAEAEEARLKNKCNLRGLTLKYDGRQPTIGHDVIDGLQPHPCLRELGIYNYTGPTCPSWLNRDICVTSLECLTLSSISWDILPPFARLPLLKSLELSNIGGLRQLRLDSGGLTYGSFKHLKTIKLSEMPDLVEWIGGDNSHLFSTFEYICCSYCPNLAMLPFSNCNGLDITWFPVLRRLDITDSPKLSQLPPLPYTSTLTSIRVTQGWRDKLFYENNKKSLTVDGYSGALAFHNLSIIESMSMANAPHTLLTDLQKLKSLRELSVRGETFSRELGGSVVLCSVQKLTLERFPPTEWLLTNVFKCLPALSELEMSHSNEDHGELVLQFPSSSLLRKVQMSFCNNLILNPEGGGALRDLTSLRSLIIRSCGKIFSRCSLAEATQIVNPLPASLRELNIKQVDMLSMGMLSNLTSLTSLRLYRCDDLAMDGLSTLITRNLKRFHIRDCGSIETDLPSEVTRTVPVGSCQLEHLEVDSIAAVLVPLVCTRLSATLRSLFVYFDKKIERFTEEQEEALCLFTTLEELEILGCNSLESLPEVLHRLCSLKKVSIVACPKIRCLPKYGLPTSLQFLKVSNCTREFHNKVSDLEESHPDLEIRLV